MSAEGGTHDLSLVVQDLTKQYADAVTIGPLSFSVEHGEFFSLLGPSGCGKSTTLRCIAGFETPTSGTIYLSGRRLDTIPPHKRDLGLVFQSHALFPHLSIGENVAFGLRLRKVGANEVVRQVTRALGLVGLTGLEARMPSQISGGQQQRVALARSLVLEPPLLLLDEPLSSLDLKLRQQMRDELRKLQRQLGQTTVFVTHDQTEALSMSDRVAVLSNGRIEQIGTPKQIYQEPASRFVAEFIGQSNLIDGVVEGEAGGLLRLRLPGDHLLLARPARAPAVRTGEKIWVMLRPENLKVGPADAEARAATVLHGAVSDIEYLGEDTQIRVAVNGLKPLLASFKTTREASALVAAAAVQVQIEPDDVFLLHS